MTDNPYERWKASTREEYMKHSGGFHAASYESLELLLVNIDKMDGYQLEGYYRWALGEPGANWMVDADEAVRILIGTLS